MRGHVTISSGRLGEYRWFVRKRPGVLRGHLSPAKTPSAASAQTTCTHPTCQKKSLHDLAHCFTRKRKEREAYAARGGKKGGRGGQSHKKRVVKEFLRLNPEYAHASDIITDMTAPFLVAREIIPYLAW